MLILAQVRLSKGKLCPAGLGNGLDQGLENTPSNYSYNLRSSIKPGSAPDPKFLYLFYIFLSHFLFVLPSYLPIIDHVKKKIKSFLCEVVILKTFYYWY